MRMFVFSVPVRNNVNGWYTTQLTRVLAETREEAMKKYLEAYPENYNFTIVDVARIDIQ